MPEKKEDSPDSPFDFSAIFSLPAFQELDESKSPSLTPEEEKVIEEDAKKALAKFLLNSPAFRQLEDSKKKGRKSKKSRHRKKRGK